MTEEITGTDLEQARTNVFDLLDAPEEDKKTTLSLKEALSKYEMLTQETVRAITIHPAAGAPDAFKSRFTNQERISVMQQLYFEKEKFEELVAKSKPVDLDKLAETMRQKMTDDYQKAGEKLELRRLHSDNDILALRKLLLTWDMRKGWENRPKPTQKNPQTEPNT